MVDFLDGKFFSADSVAQLESTFDESGVKDIIDGALLIRKSYSAEKADIALDFYYDCYCFCGASAFSARKTATFMSIMHDAFIRDSLNYSPAWTIMKSYERLEQVVFKHSVQRPPHSILVFDGGDVQKILEYMVSRSSYLPLYYNQYNLYRYVFSKQVVKLVRQTLPQEVEKAPSDMFQLPPLSDAFEFHVGPASS